MLTGKHAQAREWSPSHEHYLRAIFVVRSRHGYARLSDVARELGVAPPTLSVGLRPLIQKALVAHDEHRFLVLTAAGERIAREVQHRYAVIFAFLHDVLGLPEAAAHAEACLLEHDVHAATTDRLLDLIKLLREDRALGEFFRDRFLAYRRECRRDQECATCDLTCLEGTEGASRA